MAAALQLKNIETLIHSNAQIFADAEVETLNFQNITYKKGKFYRYYFAHLW